MEITPLPSTAKGAEQWFTGDVWFDVVAAPPQPSRLRVNAVHFAPGARTFWHRHANGQALHVTEGVARVGGLMTHLAMWEAGDGSSGPDTEWAEPVTDEQYDSVRA